jgi:anti-sigma B factor antagonist
MQPADGGFSLHLEILEGPGAAVLAVRGEVDAAHADELRATLDRVLDGATPLVLDVADMSFIDSAGLNALAQAFRGREGAGIAVAAASPKIARMLEMRGLTSLVATHESVPAALASLASLPSLPSLAPPSLPAFRREPIT